MTCAECGNDDACEGYSYCSDCLEELGHEADPVDQGLGFGTWDDETSRLIYHDAMPALLSGTLTGGRTLDLGGGNGLARRWFRDLTTVDSDPGKRPDVLADLRSYVPKVPFYRVLLRYVLHYLSDAEVERLAHHLASWHGGELTVIQFVYRTPEELAGKLHNSVNERKWFRTEGHLAQLLHPWVPVHRVAVEYDVVPDFYRNRLGHPDPTGHRETVVALDLKALTP